MRRAEKESYLRAVERVAQRLGISPQGPCTDAAVVNHCRREVSRLTAEHGLPPTTAELLASVATCLGVEFVEIHSDEDLASLVRRIPPAVEPAIVRVQAELGDGTHAITIKRRAPQPWERRYLAIIDCRGGHYFRRYFSKWHELAHRLVDGEQLTVAFRHSPADRKDANEVLVDKVAAELAFFPDIVAAPARECLSEFGLTFEAADALRQSVAQEASRHATALALIRYVDRPAWFIRCGMSLKVSEKRRGSRSGAAANAPVPKLRVTEVSPNEWATRSGVRIHRWMRVPDSSLIALSRTTSVDQIGTERLESWETSEGGPIGSGGLAVDTLVLGDEVIALVSIVEERLESAVGEQAFSTV